MRTYNSIFADEIQSYISGILNSGRDIKSHEVHLGSLDRYLAENGHGTKEIPEPVAAGWLKSRKAGPNYQNTILCYYRGFANYLAAHGIMAYIPDSPYAEHTYLPYIYSDEEIDRIFRVCDNLKTRYKDCRSPIIMPMLLRLLYGTGMRLGEALRLTMAQLDLKSGYIVLLETKNNRERIVPIHHGLTEMLLRYAAAMDILADPESPVFPNRRGGFFSKRWAQGWFEDILDKAGIRDIKNHSRKRGPCLHSFRHGYAYLALKQSQADGLAFEEAIPFISTYLGHKDVAGTDYYLKFSYTLFEEEQDTFSSYTAGMFPEVYEDEEE
ncbi:MAG: tyrosine-type recombinase/integrase [Lachnospiraceae bacterium]|nr:tyrosine-type recombinase/integrase [Lachnospiraceae bacterium]